MRPTTTVNSENELRTRVALRYQHKERLDHGRPFQNDFPVEEFVARRTRVFDAIGPQAIALIQGAPGVDGFKVFRQTNEFYYLSGEAQRTLATFILEYRTAFFRHIRPLTRVPRLP